MNEEDKELLLKYICMALPYRVKIYDHLGQISTFYGIKNNFIFVPRCGRYGISYDDVDVEKIKPYLRPMSSMTEKEATEYANCGNIIAFSPQRDYLIPNPKSINWLLENHFDFMGLIPKDIAIEVTDENNPYKE